MMAFIHQSLDADVESKESAFKHYFLGASLYITFEILGEMTQSNI